ncbi:hypothetical protein QE152_g13277 [Popillia japonica]|uniref:Uncharacterized protein n=1 Tax=Popillia japonica TaxID=7064 RepID=A0AAW1LE39_POPJA
MDDANLYFHMWNMYDRVLNLQDRTNNHAEAAHRRLQIELTISADHLTMWKFIECLRKIQAYSDLYYEQLVAGHPSNLLNVYEKSRLIPISTMSSWSQDILHH